MSSIIRTFLAILVSFAFLGLIYVYSDLNIDDYKKFSSIGVVGVVISHCLVLTCRGILMWYLSILNTDRSDSAALWIRIAARHQLIFTVMPSGLGDLLFPSLASRIVKTKTHDAFRIIAAVRARDLVLVPGMALSGALIVTQSVFLGILALVPTFILLLKVDWLIYRALPLISQLMPRGRIASFLKAAASAAPGNLTAQVRLAILSSFGWAFATMSVLASFAAIDQPIGLGLALLFLASINFFGAIAISIGGLGLSEAGGAAALLFAKRSVKHASTLALLVRPLLLASMLTACILVDLAMAIFDRNEKEVSTSFL